GSALDTALARLADIKLPIPQDFFSDRRPSRTERSEAFLEESIDRDVYVQQVLQGPISPYEIKAGSIIPAALITGLNSDLPGQIIGQVTEPVYDTVTGQHRLIPQGTKIVGRYNADIGHGQDRLQIVWDRLVMNSALAEAETRTSSRSNLLPILKSLEESTDRDGMPDRMLWAQICASLIFGHFMMRSLNRGLEQSLLSVVALRVRQGRRRFPAGDRPAGSDSCCR
ncbi:MAG: hypothetical protein HC871_06955, partial [Rhizobiales bacterium]|nr:hypothetical protein [Hyphomicrobiales bacterium]